jgi:hypothetical protein
MFKKAGYGDDDVKMPNSEYYHEDWGNIHCGTNVRRTIP